MAADGCFGAEDAPGVLGGGFLADPGKVLALRIEAERYRLDEQAAGRRHEYGKQRGLEGQQTATVGCGAFGEDGDRLAGGKCCAEFGDLFSDTSALGAGDEDRIVELCQPADNGPVLDLVLCDKGCAGEGGEDGNVDPADMIGDIEDIVDQRAAFAGDADTEDARRGGEEAAGPWRGGCTGFCAEPMAGQADGECSENGGQADDEAHGPAGILEDRARWPHGDWASRVGRGRQAEAYGSSFWSVRWWLRMGDDSADSDV